jgi:hypothetical protein
MRKRRITALVLGTVFALSAPAAALADTTGKPWAGESGHFKGGSKPCKASSNNPHCPPFG